MIQFRSHIYQYAVQSPINEDSNEPHHDFIQFNYIYSVILYLQHLQHAEALRYHFFIRCCKSRRTITDSDPLIGRFFVRIISANPALVPPSL
jgi:hypothetical protein